MSTQDHLPILLTKLNDTEAAKKLDRALTNAAKLLGEPIPTPSVKVTNSIAKEVLTEIVLENQKEAREKLKTALKQVMAKKQAFEKAYKEGVKELAKTLDTKRTEITNDLQAVLKSIDALDSDLEATTNINDEKNQKDERGGEPGAEDTAQNDTKS